MVYFSLFMYLALVGSCLAIPGYGGVKEETLESAPKMCGHPSYDCVPYYQCVDGKINTDGAGLFDVRILPVGSCVNPEYPRVPSLCCLIPGAVSPTPPAEVCPHSKVCVDDSLCGVDGKVITDGQGLVDIRTGIRIRCTQSSGKGGVCCTPPQQYVECPVGSACTLEEDCFGQALESSGNYIDYIKTGSWSFCNYAGQDGVCCVPPPPKYVKCPAGSVCTLEGDCFGEALDASSTFIEYTMYGSWSFCNYAGQDGVCCIPPPPQYIECPGDSVCVHANECTGRALDKYNNFLYYSSTGDWAHCFINEQVGICCEPEVITVPYCPDNSVCVIPADCFGTALSAAGSFISYNFSGTWSHCPQHPQGICCENPPQCGIRNYEVDQQITDINHNGKTEAGFGEFPWQAILFYANYTFICGASLISDRHVITAAHCVDDGIVPGDVRLRFGEWAVNTYDEPYEYHDKNVKAIHLHPKFNYRNNRNDIAVLELAEPFESFFYHINSICLPGPSIDFGSNYRCIATGWGKETFDGDYQVILKKVDLPYVPHAACQDKLRRTRLGKWFALDPSFVCAGGEFGKDACKGDGGGPLVCQDINTLQYILVGVTSFGIGCGQKDIPGVYADVEYLLPWVEAIVLGDNGHQPIPGYGK